jgi:hemerythrin
MDEEHREFVEVVKGLLACPGEQMLARLDRFCTHAESHFGTEDRWMTETEFPARECHMAEHAAVLASAREVRALVAAGNHEVGRSLALELARWFPGHADYLDSALAHWMFKRDHGGKPIVLRRRAAA